MVDISALEPIAGTGLAISLAYLALERFRYRRDVENEAHGLHVKYENNPALTGDETLEHLGELRWICRKPSNGHKPNGLLAAIYGGFYRWHGDVYLVSAMACITAILLIVGVAGQAELIDKVTSAGAIRLGFWICTAAVTLPGFAVLMGRWCRIWAIKRAKQCDTQIAHSLVIFAQNTAAPGPDHPS